MATLVDSNVILDVVTEDVDWMDWSAAMLARAADSGRLVINPIVYAEVSVRFDTIEALDAVLPADYYTREALPWEAAFLAARALLTYRRRGGTRHATLPDFFVGAHAAVAGHTLLTRNPRRYRTYFPKLKLSGPQQNLDVRTVQDGRHPATGCGIGIVRQSKGKRGISLIRGQPKRSSTPFA